MCVKCEAAGIFYFGSPGFLYIYPVQALSDMKAAVLKSYCKVWNNYFQVCNN